MNIDLKPGKYVIAVSGGVDSVVLLHILTQRSKASVISSQESVGSTENRILNTDHPSHWQLVVAHFDHGIRGDSIDDRRFTENLAIKYKMPFYYDEGKLGPDTNEAQARIVRYTFLRKIRKSTKSKAIITAHHQDDRIETAFINLLRGTGRKGLSSLGSGSQIVRPLLNMSKREIIEYAGKHNLKCREDSTNQDNKYLRNNLRNRILSGLTDAERQRMVKILDSANRQNQQIDTILDKLLSWKDGDQINRAWFIALPHTVSGEVLSHWLRNENIGFDHRAIERLVVSLKTLHSGAKTDITAGWYFAVSKDTIRLRGRSSV